MSKCCDFKIIKIKGPTGPVGPCCTGPTGVSSFSTGPTGPSLTGPTGPMGTSLTGTTGSQGPTGDSLTGVTGPTGVSLTGPTGSQGLTGASLTGVTGPTGAFLTGPTGSQGPTGFSFGEIRFSSDRSITEESYIGQGDNLPSGLDFTNFFELAITTSHLWNISEVHLSAKNIIYDPNIQGAVIFRLFKSECINGVYQTPVNIFESIIAVENIASGTSVCRVVVDQNIIINPTDLLAFRVVIANITSVSPSAAIK